MKSINGTLHVLVLFRIIDQDALGRPLHLEMLADHDIVDLTKPENRQFMTAFVPYQMAKAAQKVKA